MHFSPATRVDALLRTAFDKLGLPVEHAFCVPSGKPDLADFQCNGAMPCAKASGRPAHVLAAAVCAELACMPEFSEASVAGPGFINMRLSPGFVAQAASELAGHPATGAGDLSGCGTLVIDFGGPNVAKPLHVGHLRSLVLGESLRRILGAVGYEVISDVHLGDWGLQMGMLTSGIRRSQPGLPYFSPDASGPWPAEPPVTLQELEVLYPAVAASCKEDPLLMEEARQDTARLQSSDPGLMALWRSLRTMSLQSLQADFGLIGAHFDLMLGESDAHPSIASMLESLKGSGAAVESDGALVVHVGEEADRKQVPPLLLAKRDGAALYATTDLATLAQRAGSLGAARIVYVVDARQSLHFEQVFRAARKTGLAGRAVLEHAGFGTVNGKDGKPYKTRDGGVARLGELVSSVIAKAAERVSSSPQAAGMSDDAKSRLARQIGIGALKFADLSGDRQSGYIFDADRMTSFEGRTGPYVQYACVRIRSILAKAAAEGALAGSLVPGNEAERAMLLACTATPAAVAEAARLLQPGILADHAFQLAQRFSRFYAECPVLGIADAALQASRLAACQVAGRMLEHVLLLLGIEIPDRM